ncbi:MAG: L-lactate dehydrogenase [Candidatus Gracilibacteria bacterium]
MAKQCTLNAFQTQFKVSVIGCGNVGATAAYAMLIDGTPTEMVLMDRNCDKAEGLKLDLEHSMVFFNNTRVIAAGDFKACKDSHLVVVTAGARQAEGETRLDLIAKNRALFRDIIPKIAKVAPRAILLIVTNPVDVLTWEAAKLSGFPAGRVFGTGTLLDTARLRFHIGEKLCLSPKSVEAFILGEHGDSSFPVWSSANIAGKPLMKFDGFGKKDANDCYKQARNAAYKIIHDMGFTCYSIATVIREIMVHIFQNSRAVLPLSVPLKKPYYGVFGVALSVPCVLGSTGVSEPILVPLNGEERKKFKVAAKAVKGVGVLNRKV